MNSAEDFVTLIFGVERKDTILALLGAAVTIVAFVGANNLMTKFVGSDKPKRKRKTTSSSSSNNYDPSSSPLNRSSSSSSNGANNKRDGNAKFNPYKKLPTFLLGALAFMGPRLFKTASTNPKFVDGLDRVFDGCQSKLREIVLSTTSIKDDEILDGIDKVLDGFQSRVRKELSKANSSNIALRVASDVEVDMNAIQHADPKAAESIENILAAADVMDKLQKGKTEEVPTDYFDAESRVPRKPVSVETEDTVVDTAKFKELAESEDSNGALDGPINFLKTLMKGYNYIRSKDGKMSYATYPRHYDTPDVDLSSMMKMMDGFPPPEYLFSPHKIRRIVRRIAPFQLGFQVTERRVERSDPEDQYKALFTCLTSTVPKNKHLLNYWEKDKEFARQFIAGVNPVMINVGKDLTQLSQNLVSHFGKNKLQGLIDEKRLFFVSYDDLADKVSPPLNGYNREFYAPVIVFELDESRKELDVMGIQLDRTDDARIYTKDDGDDWLYAKTHVAAADTNIHEWVNHLGKTHLTIEPHIIAIHNTLKLKKHKLASFFAPLIKDTLFLNWAGRKTLAGYSTDAPTKGIFALGDHFSSIGTSQYLQIIKKWWENYDFFESSGLPTELESRGFDKDFDMPCYHFREDGMKLWDAYGEFAADYVDEIYVSNLDVANDIIVQEWAEETVALDKGAVPGFPESIKDKATLVKIMQTLMWLSSGLHAALNFPQYDYYSYVPNKPWFTSPEKLTTASRDDIFGTILPDKGKVRLIVSLVQLLTMPSETCIDNLEKSFNEVGTESYKKFQLKLDVISEDIEDRNKAKKKKGEATYSYLNPANVPASIDI